MARFRGTVVGGSGGEASRLGTEKSGLVVEANGWKKGVRVVASRGPQGEDLFEVYVTDGSAGKGEAELVLGVSAGAVVFKAGEVV